MEDDPPPTPPQTPSAQQRLGLVVCPHCEDTGIEPGDPADRSVCSLCKGARRVPVDVAIEYNQKRDTDPPDDPEV